jgi:hypothetical protein
VEWNGKEFGVVGNKLERKEKKGPSSIKSRIPLGREGSGG